MNIDKSDGTQVWWSACVHCWGELPNHGLYVGATDKCTCNKIAVSGDVKPSGWYCPYCKTVYSPYEDTCLCQIGGGNDQV